MHFLGSNVKEARKEWGWTQKQLAEKVECYPTDVSGWENGGTIPRIGSVERLAVALDKPITYFFVGNDPSQNGPFKTLYNTVLTEKQLLTIHKRLTEGKSQVKAEEDDLPPDLRNCVNSGNPLIKELAIRSVNFYERLKDKNKIIELHEQHRDAQQAKIARLAVQVHDLAKDNEKQLAKILRDQERKVNMQTRFNEERGRLRNEIDELKKLKGEKE